MTLLVATRNPGKLREIRELLTPDGVQVRGLAELPGGGPRVEEDGLTFEENARKKAEALSASTRLPVLADDSGLVVGALGERPGVHSARYAGPEATDADNNRRLLAELQGVPPEGRGAAFICAMVLTVPGQGEFCAEGRLEGRILDAPRGADGFGYDPLFWVDSEGCTLAEMDLATKNRLSHRARALEVLLPRLRMLGSQ